MFTAYNVVMNENLNPLRDLPSAQRFQTMLGLSVMWTTLFCLMAGAWIWYGELLAFHLLFTLGFTITGIIFTKGSRETRISKHSFSLAHVKK